MRACARVRDHIARQEGRVTLGSTLFLQLALTRVQGPMRIPLSPSEGAPVNWGLHTSLQLLKVHHLSSPPHWWPDILLDEPFGDTTHPNIAGTWTSSEWSMVSAVYRILVKYLEQAEKVNAVHVWWGWALWRRRPWLTELSALWAFWRQNWPSKLIWSHCVAIEMLCSVEGD